MMPHAQSVVAGSLHEVGGACRHPMAARSFRTRVSWPALAERASQNRGLTLHFIENTESPRALSAQ